LDFRPSWSPLYFVLHLIGFNQSLFLKLGYSYHLFLKTIYQLSAVITFNRSDCQVAIKLEEEIA